jgi:hypothetical protein
VNFYRPPLSDIQFLLDTFDYEGQVGALPQFADYDLETCIGLIEAYGKYCMDVLMPLNGVGDQVGVRFDPETGDVHMPDGFKEAYEATAPTATPACPTTPSTAAWAPRSPCRSWPRRSSAPATRASRCARA